jgi:hypothetical protein
MLKEISRMSNIFGRTILKKTRKYGKKSQVAESGLKVEWRFYDSHLFQKVETPR